MLSTPKSNAKRNGEKKYMKGEGKLKKDSLKRRRLPSYCRSTKQKGARKTNEGTKKKTKERFFKKTMSFSLLLFSRSLQE